MVQGLFIWFITFLLSNLLIGWVAHRFRFVNRRHLVILFFYHTALALTYYVYALFNPSDSRAYFRRLVDGFRGPTWADHYGTSTTFIEFIGYPFVKYLDFNYESMMALFSFLGFVGFVFFYILFHERIKLNHKLFGISFITIIFFLPNLHFWSSSFGKGSLIFCGFGLFFFAINNPGRRILALIIGGYLIYMIRPHIFFVIMIAIFTGYTFSTKGVSVFYRVAILIISALILNYIYDDILQVTGLEDESIFEAEFSQRADRLTSATSGIELSSYSLPEKMFAFWFRPLFLDAPGFLGLIVSFENLFYLYIFASLLQPKAIGYLLRADAFTKTALLTFLGVSIALAQISGNLGLAIRQKSQVMLLMLFVILRFMDETRLTSIRMQMLRGKAQKQQEVETPAPVS